MMAHMQTNTVTPVAAYGCTGLLKVLLVTCLLAVSAKTVLNAMGTLLTAMPDAQASTHKHSNHFCCVGLQWCAALCTKPLAISAQTVASITSKLPV